MGDTHIRYDGDVHLTYGDPDNKSLYEDWVKTAAPAFTHAANFSDQFRLIKDPTKTGSSKGGPNKTNSHPAKLTLVTNWTKHLKGMNPSAYSKKVQHEMLGVK